MKQPVHVNQSTSTSSRFYPILWGIIVFCAPFTRNLPFPEPLDRNGFTLLLVAAASTVAAATSPMMVVPVVVLVFVLPVATAIVVAARGILTPGLAVGIAGIRLINIAVYIHMLPTPFDNIATAVDGFMIALHTGVIGWVGGDGRRRVPTTTTTTTGQGSFVLL